MCGGGGAETWRRVSPGIRESESRRESGKLGGFGVFFTKQDGNLGNPEFGKQVRKDEDTPGPPTPPQPPRQPHLIPRALSRGWGEEKAHLG